MRNLGGIEFAGDRGALAQNWIVDCRFATDMRTVALTRAAGRLLNPSEPPQTEGKHNGSRDYAEARSREGRRAEERHRNGILQGGRTRQRGHREGHGAEGDCGRHQAERYVGGSEQALRHGDDDKNCDEQADAAISDDCPGQNHRQHGATCAEFLRHEASDDFDRAAVLHELPE